MASDVLKIKNEEALDILNRMLEQVRILRSHLTEMTGEEASETDTQVE